MSKCMNPPYFLWRIENFASVDKDVSPALFSMGLKWQLSFSRFQDENVEKLRLILECLSMSEIIPNFQFIASVAFTCETGDVYLLKSIKYLNFKDKEWCLWTETVARFHESFKRYDSMKCTTFSVDIAPIGDLESLIKYQNSEANHETACVKSLTEDFGKLFNNDENHDFVLECAEKKFYVHRAVLSARSAFFAGMFRCSMKEANEGIGKFEYIEPDILELVLRYLYTGKIFELSTESLRKVYAAADRFGVESLKFKCSSLFMKNFINCSEENASDVTEKELENKQNEAIERQSQQSKENRLLKDLFMSKEWRLYSQEFPHKAQELCRPYLNQKL